MNTYGYANQNSVRFIDPNGLFANVLIGGTIRVVGGRAAGAAIAQGLRQVVGPTAGTVVACVLTGYCSTAEEDDIADDSASESCPVPGATPGRKTKGRTKLFEKPGDFDDALGDFDDLGPSDVTGLNDGGFVGDLPNGDKVNVRPTSSDGRPTIEIQHGKNRIKIRYGR